MERREHWRSAAWDASKSFAEVISDYLESPKFVNEYSDATKELWSRYLSFAAKLDCLGAVSLENIRPKLVQIYIDELHGSPGAQAATLCALKQLEKWAIVQDILPRSITTGVEGGKSDGGHTPWSAEHVALVERYGRPDIARVVTLGANTGQRGSDLIRMGWADIENYKGTNGIKVTQKKTGRRLWIPITDHLADAMATWKKLPGPFLKKLDGHPWTRQQLTAAWVRHRNANRDLEELKIAGLVLHGLRGHACVRLLHAGATTRMIADTVGMSEPMVKNYTKLSDQRDNAMAAVIHLHDKLRSRVA